ncbi:MAG TPA: division/cell wall cluster transcriptional repressor MraZ [Candidatus Limnocylindria bacterium]|nr:division/cell wall cluster transcriptional repressor MraZ [Candidatus Limnocylindria bacterium]
MFLGTHHPRLDDKGRLFLPARFREDLSGGLVVTRGQEGCLYVFARERFAAMAADMSVAAFTNKPARDLGRVFFAGASDEVPDKQGRITVPAALRAYAGLSKECVVIGNNDRLEIWDQGQWESYLEGQEDAFANLDSQEVPGTT